MDQPTETKAAKPSKPRISLTAKQLQADTGMQLLAICQSVTSDGRLSDEEVHELRQWISDNQGHDLPAIQHLAANLEQVLLDGIITEDERQTVYKAIEAVLPPEHRRIATDLRRQAQAEDKAEEKAAAAAQQEEERRQKAQNKGRSFNFMVAGTRHEGRDSIIEDSVSAGDAVYLRRDYNNKYSRHAIAVLTTDGEQIGFVPEDIAVTLAPLLDQHWHQKASITKLLTRGRSPIPVVQLQVFSPEAAGHGGLSSDSVSDRISKAREENRKKLIQGLLIWAALIALFIWWLRS
jgi:hypothetical protein